MWDETPTSLSSRVLSYDYLVVWEQSHRLKVELVRKSDWSRLIRPSPGSGTSSPHSGFRSFARSLIASFEAAQPTAYNQEDQAVGLSDRAWDKSNIIGSWTISSSQAIWGVSGRVYILDDVQQLVLPPVLSTYYLKRKIKQSIIRQQ